MKRLFGVLLLLAVAGVAQAACCSAVVRAMPRKKVITSDEHVALVGLHFVLSLIHI